MTQVAAAWFLLHSGVGHPGMSWAVLNSMTTGIHVCSVQMLQIWFTFSFKKVSLFSAETAVVQKEKEKKYISLHISHSF